MHNSQNQAFLLIFSEHVIYTAKLLYVAEKLQLYVYKTSYYKLQIVCP